MPKKIDSLEDRGNLLNLLMNKINECENQAMLSVVNMGLCWKRIRDEKLWRSLPYIKTFRQFCEKESKRSHATVYNYIGIVEKFGSELLETAKIETDEIVPTVPGSLAVDQTRLVRLLPYVTKENASDLLKMAQEHSKEDFENDIKELSGKGTATDACDHDDKEHWEKCTKCNKFFKL